MLRRIGFRKTREIKTLKVNVVQNDQTSTILGSNRGHQPPITQGVGKIHQKNNGVNWLEKALSHLMPLLVFLATGKIPFLSLNPTNHYQPCRKGAMQQVCHSGEGGGGFGKNMTKCDKGRGREGV